MTDRTDLERLSESPRAWSPRSIAEMCSLVTSGGTPRRSEPAHFANGTIPWVKTGELSDAYVITTEEALTETALANSAARLLPVDTVLMAMYGATVGALGILAVPAACNQASCAMVVDRSRCDPRWLFYALLNDRPRIVSLATGAAQQNLSGKAIRDFVYPTPLLPEQRAIGEVLGALDDKIAANTRLATTAEALAIGRAGVVRPTVPLSAIATTSRVMVDPAALDVSAVDLYSLPGFDANREPERVSPGDIKSGKFGISRPSVLVSKLNPRFPRVWEVPQTPERPALASTEFVVLHPTESSTAVVWALVSQPHFGGALESMVAGTSGSHQRVKPQEVLDASVGATADLSVSSHLAITALCRRAHAARAENRALAATRDALLPALMSGALRVRDAERAVEEVM